MTRHQVAYLALLALALVVLVGYVATVVMVGLELTHPALGATSGQCFACMSPWVGAEFTVGALVVLLVYALGMTCVGLGFARHEGAWSMAFLALLALAIGLTALAGSGISNEIAARLGLNGYNTLFLGAAACVLLIPLLALFYARHLRRAWTPAAASSARTD